MCVSFLTFVLCVGVCMRVIQNNFHTFSVVVVV